MTLARRGRVALAIGAVGVIALLAIVWLNRTVPAHAWDEWGYAAFTRPIPFGEAWDGRMRMGRGALPVSVSWWVVWQRVILVLAFAGGAIALLSAPAGRWKERVGLALAIVLVGVALWPTTIWLPTYWFSDSDPAGAQWGRAAKENTTLSEVEFSEIRVARSGRFLPAGPPQVRRQAQGMVRVHYGWAIHWPILLGAQSIILLFGGALIGWMLWRERRRIALAEQAETEARTAGGDAG